MTSIDISEIFNPARFMHWLLITNPEDEKKGKAQQNTDEDMIGRTWNNVLDSENIMIRYLAWQTGYEPVLFHCKEEEQVYYSLFNKKNNAWVTGKLPLPKWAMYFHTNLWKEFGTGTEISRRNAIKTFAKACSWALEEMA